MYRLHVTDCERDIVFVLENSDFLTPQQYENNLMFVSNMVEGLYDTQSQFAVLSFNDNVNLHIDFGQRYASKEQLQREVGIFCRTRSLFLPTCLNLKYIT